MQDNSTVLNKAGFFSTRMRIEKVWQGRLEQITYLGLALISVLWMLYRIHFGIDFTDEAYYSALPWTFDLGSRPFIDEINFHHTMAIVLWPFIKIFRFFHEDTDGIILFFRYLYVCVSFICSSLIFNQLKKRTSRLLSFLFALSFFLYVPFSIPALGYNNLGVLLSILSIVLAQNKTPWIQGAAGAVSALAVFSYPTMIIPYSVWLASRLIFKRDLKTLGFYVIGGLLACLPLLLVLLHFGISNISAAFATAKQQNIQHVGLQKILEIWSEAQEPLQRRLPLFIITLATLWNRKLTYFFVALLMCGYIFEQMSNTGDMGLYANLSFFYTVLCSAIPLILYFCGENRSYICDLLFGLFACLAMGYTSSNITINFSLMVPAIVLAILLTIKETTPSFLRTSMTIMLAFTCLYNAYSFGRFVYRDEAPFNTLNAEITSGPYAGMYTSPEKKAFLDQIQQNLKQFLTPEINSIAFIDDFPAGYLMTERKPKSRTIVTNQDPRIDRNMYLTGYNTTEDLPDLLYVINEAFFKVNVRQPYPMNEPMRNFFLGLIKNGTYKAFDVPPNHWVLVKAAGKN